MPSDARAFSLASFQMQSSSCDYIRTSDRLIYAPKCLLDLNNLEIFFCQGMQWFPAIFCHAGPSSLVFFVVVVVLRDVKFYRIVIYRSKF